ncbi:anaerobic benzoate catabolism transcriptional regulator [compost metagenome]
MFDAGLPETPAPRPASRRQVSSTADLGVLVRDRRLKMGLTQQDLADAAGTGRRFISELEGGKATLEFGRIIQVCRILGIDLFAMTR